MRASPEMLPGFWSLLDMLVGNANGADPIDSKKADQQLCARPAITNKVERGQNE